MAATLNPLLRAMAAHREIEFLLRVGIADALKNIERGCASERHEAAIAEVDRPLLRRGVLVLANIRQLAIAHNEAAIACGILRLKPDADDSRAFSKRRPHGRDGRGRNQRRIPEQK